MLPPRLESAHRTIVHFICRHCLRTLSGAALDFTVTCSFALLPGDILHSNHQHCLRLILMSVALPVLSPLHGTCNKCEHTVRIADVHHGLSAVLHELLSSTHTNVSMIPKAAQHYGKHHSSAFPCILLCPAASGAMAKLCQLYDASPVIPAKPSASSVAGFA